MGSAAWLNSFKSRKNLDTKSIFQLRRRRRCLLAVELLEDRCLLSAAGIEGLMESDALQFDSGSYAADHILVLFKEGASPVQGLRLMQDGDLWKVPTLAGSTVEQTIAVYKAQDDVLYAQPDYRVYVQAENWEGNTGAGEKLWGLGQIDAPAAWQNMPAGSGKVVVAVVDSGVDYNHPDLAANIWTNTGEIAGDGMDNDGNGYIDDIHGYDFHNDDGDPMDDHGHGTHVSGTIGAVRNDSGVVGVAADHVKIVGLKFLDQNGSGNVSNAIRALDYINKMDIRISNHSWGLGTADPLFAYALEVTNANVPGGHLLAAAAGNGHWLFGFGLDNDTNPHYPSNYSPEQDTVIAVAASTESDTLTVFSNFGKTTVDLAAPGQNILSTVPANGALSDPSGYAYALGTSMATPHVAGAAALVMAANPSLTAAEVKDILLSTTDYIGNENENKPTVTNGRLNANAAVALAQNYSPDNQLDTGGIYVRNIVWTPVKGKGKSTDLNIKVHVARDSGSDGVNGGTTTDAGGNVVIDANDSAVSGAVVAFWLVHIDTQQSWQGQVTTGADGTASFNLSRAPTGQYWGKVAYLTHSSLDWNRELDGKTHVMHYTHDGGGSGGDDGGGGGKGKGGGPKGKGRAVNPSDGSQSPQVSVNQRNGDFQTFAGLHTGAATWFFRDQADPFFFTQSLTDTDQTVLKKSPLLVFEDLQQALGLLKSETDGTNSRYEIPLGRRGGDDDFSVLLREQVFDGEWGAGEETFEVR